MLISKRIRFLFGNILLLGVMVFLAVIPSSDAAFADQTTISIVADPLLEWDITPGSFESIDYPVQIVTNSPYGYSVFFQTSGQTTDLVHTANNTYRVPTIELPLNESSVPSSAIHNAYAYSLDGVRYKPVPSVNGQVDNIVNTNQSSPNVPQTHTLTFGAEVDDDVHTGTYTNTFLITAVVNAPVICDPDTICYVENGVTSGRELEDQSAPSNTEVILQAPNYYRVGYGFAGWNTRMDGTGTNYGPHESVTVGDLSVSGMILYANWIPSSGELQHFSDCQSLGMGESIALTDNRDGNVYVVTKLADGACWMTENLKLDFSDPNVIITPENTNNPTAEFMATVNAHPASSNNFCTTNNASCANQVLYNTDNVNLSLEDNYYTYGAYYNWHTVTAGHGTWSSTSTTVRMEGDICPAGWRLPTGVGKGGDFAKLDIALGGNGSNINSTTAPKRWRKYPANFIYSGQIKTTGPIDLGVSGNFVSSNAINAQRFANLWMKVDLVNMNSNGSNKVTGQSVRCIIKDEYTIHFNKNTTQQVTGTMDDQKIMRGSSVPLRKNTFTTAMANDVWYRFSHWNTKANGSGTSYNDSATVKDLAAADGEITLYAQWEEVHYSDVEVHFDDTVVSQVDFENADYGNVSAEADEDVVKLANNKEYTVKITISDVDYIFERWDTDANGSLVSNTSYPGQYTVTDDAEFTVSTEYKGRVYMQNLAQTACTSEPSEVYDLRDNEAYQIQRLADGKCWMIDDLRLGQATITETLSPANTNMEEGVTFSMPTPTSAVNSYTDPQINTDHQGAATSFGDGFGLAGTLYNFCAASTGTVCSDTSPEVPTSDICPAGWTLPTGGASATSDFQILSDAFGSITDLRDGASLTYSGWYDNRPNVSALVEYGSASYLWSKTPSNATNKSYVMIVGNNKRTLNVGYFESYGMAVRCVMK